jgi:DNA-binding MarR family transcriptional regulator
MTNESWINALSFAGKIHPQLRVSQLKFLWMVDRNPCCTQSQLADLMGCTLPAISRQIDVFGFSVKNKGRHLNLGFVEAVRSSTDERAIRVKLSPKGRDFLAALNNTVQFSS